MGYGVTGVVNIPVSDSFALRASGFYRSDGGYHRVDRQQPDPDPAGSRPSTSSTARGSMTSSTARDVTGGRVSALFRPSDNFSLDLTVHLPEHRQRQRGTSSRSIPSRFEPLYGGLVASRYHDEPTDIDYRLYSATLDWDFGGVTLQSVTSYSEFSEDFQRDIAAFDAVGAGSDCADS